MHLDDFGSGSGFIQRIDPRVKLLVMIPFIFYVALNNGYRDPLMVLLLMVVALLLFRLNLQETLKRLIPPNLFVLFLLIIMPFSVPGEGLFNFMGLTYTRDGFYRAVQIGVKANAIVLCTLIMLGTIPVFRLTHALRSFRLPEKLVQLFFFCYRYLTVLHGDYTAIMAGMRARGFQAGSNLRTYRSYANLTAILTLRSFDHSQKIYQAMVSRGYQGKFPTLFEFRLKVIDLCFLTIFLLIFAGILVV